MPKKSAVVAMLALEELRDCGTLANKQHLKVYRMCEELQDIYKELLEEQYGTD